MARILVIEDEPDILLSVELTLELVGHQVTGATSAEEALEHIEGGAPPPDLILLDLRLPGLDGFDLFGLLQERAAWSDVPVVVISAHATPATQSHALEIGCSAYLTKPFTGEVLCSTVDTVLSG